jgi:hypothetical protein
MDDDSLLVSIGLYLWPETRDTGFACPGVLVVEALGRRFVKWTIYHRTLPNAQNIGN